MGEVPKETGLYWKALTCPSGAAVGKGVEELLWPWLVPPTQKKLGKNHSPTELHCR